MGDDVSRSVFEMGAAFFMSSIWHCIKQHVTVVKENSRRLIGSCNNVAFWLDNLLPASLAGLFNIPKSSYHLFTARMSAYMADGEWNIPEFIVQRDASIRSLIDHIILPRHPLDYRLVRYPSKDGNLSVKQSFEFLYSAQQRANWATWIWHACVPPAASFIAWRCFHNKMPTNENLITRGCIVVSGCALCLSNVETTSHVFLSCSFATQI
jgi:hypothetical protein